MKKTATWHWTVDPTTEQGKACKRWDEAKENFIAIDGTSYPVGHKFEGEVV